jgi:hypothetical protein
LVTPSSQASLIKEKTPTYVPAHAKRNFVFGAFFKICQNTFFVNFVTFLIIANTLVLALDRYGIS